MKKPAVQSILLVVTLLAAVFVAGAQQPEKIPRIGFLSGSSAESLSARVEAFRNGLRELGYVEGQNIVVEWRYAEGERKRLKELAAELVRLKVDVIVSAGVDPTHSAKKETSTIPIVMAGDHDPIGNGFVASLARPGGNITGLSTRYPETTGKQLELLKEITPRLSRVVVLLDLTASAVQGARRTVERVAQAFKVKIQYLDIRSDNSSKALLRAANEGRADALIELGSAFIDYRRPRTVELAAKSRLPAIYGIRDSVERGGLMSLGANYTALAHRSALYVDKILRGAKAADLPVEQPMKLEFIVNLRAASEIGLTIPPWVLMQADEVIN